MGGLWACGHRFVVECALGLAHVGRCAWQTLDAASVVAVCAGNTRAIYIGCALLQSRLACLIGGQWQHGPFGGHWHHGGLAVVHVAVADSACRSHGAFVF